MVRAYIHTYMCALSVDASMPDYTVFLYTFICTHTRAYSTHVHTCVHRCALTYMPTHIMPTHAYTCTMCAHMHMKKYEISTVYGILSAASPAPLTCTRYSCTWYLAYGLAGFAETVNLST